MLLDIFRCFNNVCSHGTYLIPTPDPNDSSDWYSDFLPESNAIPCYQFSATAISHYVRGKEAVCQPLTSSSPPK
ncbi:hypothetical protein STEG23_034655, partial [Scotinomys teguina]